jgi:hypothetical protein
MASTSANWGLRCSDAALAGLRQLQSLRMDDCAALVPAAPEDLSFVTELSRLTELSWAATSGAHSWMDPALSAGGGAISLLAHAAHLTSLQRCDALPETR